MDVRTKFSIGDKVWTLKDGKAIEFEIKSISIGIGIDSRYVFYSQNEFGCDRFDENDVFPSKEELKNYVFGDAVSR